MAYCKKCGAYIPIEETACPACGYDPEEEARQAREAEEAKKRAEEEERKRREKEAAWAERERQREAEERRRAEERRKQTYSYGAAQAQYTSQHTGQSSAYQSQQTSQHTGQTWTPPWTQQQGASQQSHAQYEEMREQARESVANQKLSVLSYLGPLMFIPLFTRGKDDFARYHSNQGLSLFLFNAAMGIVGEAFGGLVAAAGSVFGLYCMVKGISNVLKGKKEPLPLIGGFKFLK